MYLDTSAAVKVLFEELETPDVRRELGRGLLSSALLAVELGRVVRWVRRDGESAARQLLAGVSLSAISEQQLTRATELEPAPGRQLGTLDALHLAAAQQLGERVICTYDSQQAAAADHHGLEVLSPGRPERWWELS